ncbi:MAG: STAS domain-containing protein [Bacillota bacterium]
MISKLMYDDERGVWSVTIEGDLDVYHAPNVISMIESAYQQHPAAVEIDCKGLEYVDSMGLGALVKINSTVKESGAIRLMNLKQRVYKLFEITHLDTLLKIEVAP